MQSALQELETTYFTLQGQIGMLTAACTTDQQRDDLIAKYVAARSNYWICVNKAFHDDDPEVVSLTARLNASNTQLKVLVQQMGNISKVIDGITQAVTIGSSLAAKVITL